MIYYVYSKIVQMGGDIMKEEKIFKITQEIIDECLEESIEKPENTNNNKTQRIA